MPFPQGLMRARSFNHSDYFYFKFLKINNQAGHIRLPYLDDVICTSFTMFLTCILLHNFHIHECSEMYLFKV